MMLSKLNKIEKLPTIEKATLLDTPPKSLEDDA